MWFLMLILFLLFVIFHKNISFVEIYWLVKKSLWNISPKYIDLRLIRSLKQFNKSFQCHVWNPKVASAEVTSAPHFAQEIDVYYFSTGCDITQAA